MKDEWKRQFWEGHVTSVFLYMLRYNLCDKTRQNCALVLTKFSSLVGEEPVLVKDTLTLARHNLDFSNRRTFLVAAAAIYIYK
jgi:hypothetical protein